MTYEYITNRTSPNQTPGASCKKVFGYARTIDFITIHWWGDPTTKPSFNGVVDYLCRNGGSSSAHEVIEAGRVACIVAHANAAWQAGNSKGNATSIGLELNPRCSDGDYATAAERIADIWRLHGRVIPLKPHREWKATACPGNYDLARLNREAQAFYGKPAPTPNPTPNPTPVPKKKVDEMLLLRCNDGPQAGAVVLILAGKVIPVFGTANYAALQGAITPVGVSADQWAAITGALS